MLVPGQLDPGPPTPYSWGELGGNEMRRGRGNSSQNKKYIHKSKKGIGMLEEHIQKLYTYKHFK